MPELPDDAAFARMALDAFARIPAPFSDFLADVRVTVADFADAETLAAVGLSDKWQLSGLYHGHSLDEQSVWSSGEMPPVITLYRLPILQESRQTGVPLDRLVHHVVIHEVGHHFGLSDEDMHALEQQPLEED